MGIYTFVLKVSVPEEHFDVISSKEISLVNKSVVMALV
jgi:hypothetical protein